MNDQSGEIRIRRAEVGDAVGLSRLVLSLADTALAGGEGPLPDWFADGLTVKAFSERLQNPTYVQFLCEVDGKLAGYIALRGKDHIYHLFVDSDYQRRGIARRLWRHLLNQCPSAYYWVRSSLVAVPVYERFGFRENGLVERKEVIVAQPMEWRAGIS